MRLLAATVTAVLFASLPAPAHDIYTGVKGKDGQLCCGGEGINPDCRPTVYREAGDAFEFRMVDGDWLRLPVDRITFLPVAGDKDADQDHRAHLCVRTSADSVYSWRLAGRDYQIFRSTGGHEVVVFCAFINPGGA